MLPTYHSHRQLSRKRVQQLKKRKVMFLDFEKNVNNVKIVHTVSEAT